MDRAYRSWSRLTAADIQRIADSTPAEKYLKGGLGDGTYMPEYTDALNGREVKVTLGDRALALRFVNGRKVEWSLNGSDFAVAEGGVHLVPGETDLYFIQYYCAASNPPTAHNVVLDFATGHAIVIISTIDHPITPMEVRPEIIYGTIDGIEVNGENPFYTDDLIGKAIVWEYNEGGARVKYMFASPGFYTYACCMNDEWWMATNPADAIRINDHLYLMSIVEERQGGTHITALMNLKEMRDVVGFFGCSPRGLECYTAGAKGEWSEMGTTRAERAMLAEHQLG